MANGKYLQMFDVKKALKKNGWVYTRQSGDHCIWRNGSNTLCIPIRTRNAYLIKSVLRRNDIVF